MHVRVPRKGETSLTPAIIFFLCRSPVKQAVAQPTIRSGTIVRVWLKFVLNYHKNRYFHYAISASVTDSYRNSRWFPIDLKVARWLIWKHLRKGNRWWRGKASFDRFRHSDIPNCTCTCGQEIITCLICFPHFYALIKDGRLPLPSHNASLAYVIPVRFVWSTLPCTLQFFPWFPDFETQRWSQLNTKVKLKSQFINIMNGMNDLISQQTK